jgi:hypothetical protein
VKYLAHWEKSIDFLALPHLRKTWMVWDLVEGELPMEIDLQESEEMAG